MRQFLVGVKTYEGIAANGGSKEAEKCIARSSGEIWPGGGTRVKTGDEIAQQQGVHPVMAA